MIHSSVKKGIELGTLIKKVRSETEEQRQLPQQIVDALVDAQFFRLAVTSELGGMELDPVVALQVYEALATAEGSVGWLVWNSSLPCLFSRFLSIEMRKQIFGDSNLKYANSTRPAGRASIQPEGFKVNGQWSLVSGCLHADWIGLMCMVEKDGELKMSEMGGPEMVLVYIPSNGYEILDTWHVGGLRGTGSNDVKIKDLVVKKEQTISPFGESLLDRPIGRIPIACTMSAGHASVCLGITQAALDSVIELGKSKVTVDPVPGLPDRAANQFCIAQASVKITALRAHLHNSLGNLWERCQSGPDWTMDDLANVWSASVTTGRECRTIVSNLYEVAGSTALYQDFILERCHRDIHAAMQHVVIQRLWLEESGRVKFGMEPTNPLFGW
jgi:alkylation response protein AidB-like acyl-CoA dehydrogenase